MVLESYKNTLEIQLKPTLIEEHAIFKRASSSMYAFTLSKTRFCKENINTLV